MSRTPAARLIIGGKDVTSEVFGKRGPLFSLSVTDEAGRKSDAVELELDDREGFKAPAPNTEIQVWLGYEPTPVYMGRYKVDQWTKRGGDSGRMLHVSAKAAELTSDIRAARARSYHGKTVGQIVNEVAGRHGLTAVVDPEVAGRPIGHIDQSHESDVHFLTRLAHRNGATFKLADGKIVIAKKGATKLPSGSAKPTITLTPGMVATWTATSANRGDYKAVSAQYGDHKHGRRGRVRSGAGNPEHRVRVLYATKNEAHRASFAAQHDLKRGTANFETEGAGLPDVFAECVILAKGFDPDVDGEYVVKSVRHVLESRGFRTTLTMETLGEATDSETDTSDGDTEASP